MESLKKKQRRIAVVPKKKKAKKKLYFGMEVQDAIVRYNDTDNTVLKNKIYQEEIHAAFMKLAENLIHTFKFYHFDYPSTDVQMEVVAFLVINMKKYQPDKGRAFSYFSIVAKNWLILHNNGNYKKYKTHMKLDAEAFKRNMAQRSEDEEQQDELKDFVATLVLRDNPNPKCHLADQVRPCNITKSDNTIRFSSPEWIRLSPNIDDFRYLPNFLNNTIIKESHTYDIFSSYGFRCQNSNITSDL